MEITASFCTPLHELPHNVRSWMTRKENKSMIAELYNGHEYWQIWIDDDSVVSNRGVIGKKGKIDRNRLPSAESAQHEIDKEVKKAIGEGFAFLPTEKRKSIMIDYELNDWQPEDVAVFEAALKDLLGNELGWTGNGFYDGYAIGKKCLTVWCMVVEIEPALMTIINILKNHNYLQDEKLKTTIAIQKQGAFEVAYPPERKGEQILT